MENNNELLKFDETGTIIVKCDKRAKTIVIPYGCVKIEDKAFVLCRDLTTVVIPNTVEEIGVGAFWGCRSLTDISIPDSVTTISPHAFSGCISLKSIFISSFVQSIGLDAFMACTSLVAINVADDNMSYKSIDGVLYTKNGKMIIRYPTGKKTPSYTILNDVSEIDSHAFSGCQVIKEIKISENTIVIGNGAFSGCTSLTDIEIPNKVTKIGESAFLGCSNLKTVEFKEYSLLRVIEEHAFHGCKSLESISLPDGLENIKNGTFHECISLQKIVIPSSVDTIVKSAFEGCTNIKTVILPDNWEHIRTKYGFPSASHRNEFFDRNNELGSSENGPMTYTHGRLKPCPYCENNGVSTFADGTAQCNKCKRWFRYF